MSHRTFKIAMSERCYRFKPDALDAHAPPRPGVYEFVAFDELRQPTVLFVGLALESLYRSLAAHLAGTACPTREDLFAVSPDVYFDYVASSDARSPEDLKDIAGALVARHQPRFNPGPPAFSGRYSEVVVEEA